MIKEDFKWTFGGNKFIYLLEHNFSYSKRKFFGFILGFISLVFLLTTVLIKVSVIKLPTILAYIVSVFLSIVGLIPGVNIFDHNFYDLSIFPYLNLHLSSGLGIWNGVMLISLSLYILIKVLNIYTHVLNFKYLYLSFYNSNKIDTSVKNIFLNSKYGDLIYSFSKDKSAREVILRSGCSINDLDNYLLERSNVYDFRRDDRYKSVVKLSDLVELVYSDYSFKSFFDSQNISLENLLDSVKFVESIKLKKHTTDFKNTIRFALKYKTILNYILIKNSVYIKRFLTPFSLLSVKSDEAHTNINLTKLKMSLEENKNVLIIESNIFAGDYIISQLLTNNLFKNGYYSSKIFYRLDIDELIEKSFNVHDDLVGIFDELKSIGDVILVVNSFDKFINCLNDVFDEEEISNYVNTNKYIIIAIVNNNNFEIRNNIYSTYFETVITSFYSKKFVYLSLVNKILEIEKEGYIYFSIKDINRAINILLKEKNSNLHLISTLMLETALKESSVPVFTKNQNIDIFQRSNGKISLIEEALRKNIVGQDRAITSIIKALKEKDRKNKIPSLLLLGSDEDLKRMLVRILAYFLFGTNSAIFELNMEDFGKEDSLIDILSGDLKTLKKYLSNGERILVLNNFEKANRSVKNLFKQIIQNGFITYEDGSIVHCENILIVAFSSIGSIEARINSDKFLNGGYHELYRNIIDGALNRGLLTEDVFEIFEGDILFRDFTSSEHREIAKILLQNLSKNIQKDGYILIINDYLIDTVVKYGVDPSYGISPMRKAITEVIYGKIKEKISKGELVKGDRIEFNNEF